MAIVQSFLAIFFDNYNNSFHKRSFWCAQFVKILVGSKVMTLITIFFLFLFFQFCKKKNEKLQFINGHFTTIYGHFSANHDKIFHKTEVQTVFLRCLVYLNQKLRYNISQKHFFSCLKMHHFKAILPKCFLTPLRKPALIFQ